ncbi:GNAT family N-acetyltransferase [Rickettsiales endosymbiont of Stachyamoeba lipophora]|uniref:GNAT family N-acetyltransferase n=1 Tax=Rickettsiales endosymbiont of Stachyamoeba lipophora TaxID=2486578 RepID=UPI0019D22A9B|nr:hypothetical protein [Rickettsiales endosymbiont of Stachyamoeba lipophora]
MIKTERLILRKWVDTDIEPFMRINQDIKVIEYLRGSMDINVSKTFTEEANQATDQLNFGLWAAMIEETEEN